MTENGSGLAALSGLDDPVRRRLYELVAGRDEPVGRDEAAAATGIGRALAAYHLDKLVGLGLLTASYQRPGGRGGPGAGRPAKLYTRFGREFAVTVPPREYELAARLLAQAVESDRSGRAGPRCTTPPGSTVPGSARPPGRGTGAAAPAVAAVLREHGFEPFQRRGGHQAAQLPVPSAGREAPGDRLRHEPGADPGVVAGLGATGMRPALDPAPGAAASLSGPTIRLPLTMRTNRNRQEHHDAGADA